MKKRDKRKRRRDRVGKELRAWYSEYKQKQERHCRVVYAIQIWAAIELDQLDPSNPRAKVLRSFLSRRGSPRG